MISECLQKDPAKRPTASELLKHAFFKNKAKDKKYLQSVLVNVAPNPEVRMNKSKPKKPGTSGRLHRNETGDWVWSDDEEGDSDDETIQKKPPKKVNQVVQHLSPARSTGGQFYIVNICPGGIWYIMGGVNNKGNFLFNAILLVCRRICRT